jgi:hypothetical protein
MYGTATGIRDISDLVQQQKQGKQPDAWISGSTATLDFVQSSFPDLKIKPFFGSKEELDREMDQGNCEIYILDAPLVAHDVLRRFQRGQCIANGKVRLLKGSSSRRVTRRCILCCGAILLYRIYAMLNLLLLVAVGTACWSDWRANGLWSVALRDRC